MLKQKPIINKKLSVILLVAIVAGSTAAISVATITPNTYIAFAQEVPPNVAEKKLGDALQALTTSIASETHEQAVDQIMESLFMSNVVVLPTQGVPTGHTGFDEHQTRMADAIAALDTNSASAVTTGDAVRAAEASNFLQVVNEALKM